MGYDILEKLDQIQEQDRKAFLLARAHLRRSYLMTVQMLVGIDKYGMDDDTFMDAIDMKVEMLMSRAGAGLQEPTQPASDPFAHITRPSELRVLEQEIAKQIEDMAKKKPVVPNDGWST